MRADHTWPQFGQSYHASTHELSAVGATRHPQSGQFIEAVAASNLDMPVAGATTVPWQCDRTDLIGCLNEAQLTTCTEIFSHVPGKTPQLQVGQMALPACCHSESLSPRGTHFAVMSHNRQVGGHRRPPSNRRLPAVPREGARQ
jgi:hypothetical protein